MILLIAVSGTTVSVSCKNKKADSTTQENKTQPTENKVEISSDEKLRSSVKDVVKAYEGVRLR